MLIIIVHTVRLSGLYAEKILQLTENSLTWSTRHVYWCFRLSLIFTDLNHCQRVPAVRQLLQTFTSLASKRRLSPSEVAWQRHSIGGATLATAVSYCTLIFRMQALTRYFWRKSRPQRWNALATALARWYLIQHSSEHFSIQKKWFCRQKKIKIKNVFLRYIFLQCILVKTFHILQLLVCCHGMMICFERFF